MVLEQVDRWDLSDHRTLKGYPFYHGPVKFDEPDIFERIKAEYKSTIKNRLASLKTREEKLAGPIEGIDIEHELQHIASLCGARSENLFFGIATCVNNNFNPERRKILYKLLNKIEEAVPQRGISINWQKVLSRRR